ncbi:MAG: hypothetical protein SFU56_08345 [Capsulimonadales bacterium]|nr:hypothetical protein [Capsulimonadales bacterium]
MTSDLQEATRPDDSPANPGSETVVASLSPEEWRQHLAGLAARDLLALLNEDRARANRIFAGFRPSGDALKNPRVIGRIVEEAGKQAKFAESLRSLAPKPTPAAAAPVKTPPATPAREIENLRKEVAILRDALEKRKATVLTREMELRETKAALARAEQERDLARQTLAQAQDALHQAEEEKARLRHQLRREERRDEGRERKAVVTTVVEPAPSGLAEPLPAPSIVPRASLLAEGAERLLKRARYGAVIDLCREALNADAAREDSAGRGRTHALYAAALYGQGQTAAGEEQSRLAIPALLDGGEVLVAAEVALRFLSEAKNLRKTDGEPLRRLVALARRTGVEARVASLFRQLRLRSRIAYQRLGELLGSAGKDLLEISGVTTQIGPDQPVLLPTFNSMPVTPRRLVQAVESGEADMVRNVRQGVAALRAAGEAENRRADALLETVAALEPATVEPFLRTVTAPILVDASNVARFNPDPLALTSVPRTLHLRRMRDFLLRAGFFPVLMIADANLGRHVDDRAGFRQLVDRDIVREVPAGTSADDELIRQARFRHAPIVSNDMFGDQDDVSDITRIGFHIHGSTIGLFPNE